MLGLVKLWKTWGTENVRLVSNEEGYLKRTSKPRYMSQKMFDNDLVAILKFKFTLTLNKLAYVGMCLLHLSKVFMYEFHYKYIKKKFYKTIHWEWYFDVWNENWKHLWRFTLR